MNRNPAAHRGGVPIPAPLRGRDAEVAAIEGLLDDLRARRHAGVLALVGEPGFGTSALLERAAALAGGMRVLRCVGAPAEAALPFAGVFQVVRPLLGLIDRLPAPQAAALRGAFGISPERVEDRFLISVGVLSLLGEAAEEVPLVCLVDEVRWLDQESADVLGFVARRLEREPVAVLVAFSGEEARRLHLPNAVRLRLGPLGEADALAVVRDATGTAVSPVVAERIVGAAAGVPLLLRELVASLTTEQLEGLASLPVVLPLSTGVDDPYLKLAGDIPLSSRTAILVAAATEPADLTTVTAALGVLGLDAGALDEAARGGFLDVGDEVRFSNPALGFAVYSGATPSERRRVHDALASVLVDPRDEDRRILHRAAAALGPDEAVATELERSADRAAARSGCVAAASALERAAELSADEAGRGRRLACAAEMAWLGGQPDRALALAGRAEAASRDPLTEARIGFVRGAWEAQHGVTSDAVPILLHAAEVVAADEPSLALRHLVAGMMLMSLTGRQVSVAELRRLERLGRMTSPRTDRALSSVLEVNRWMAGGATTPAPVLPHDLAAQLDGLEDPVLAPFTVTVPAYLGDLGAARMNAARVVRGARARGALSMLAFALRQLAALEIWGRRFDDARIHAAEGLRLAEETGNVNVSFVHHALLAAVGAVRGEEAACRQEAEAARTGAIERGNLDAMGWVHLALGHLELSLGRPDACERFEAMFEQPWIGEPRLVGAADAVEAAVHADRRDLAESWFAYLARWTEQTRADWSLPLVARCRALLAEGDGAEGHFEEALRLHLAAGTAFDRARTQLLFGEFLRRARRRTDARFHLRTAVETFASVGSALWEERARRELRATGEVMRRRSPDAIWQLTPQELQIAQLVARGASNRDVAAELFLSPRTVEYHLRKIFTKLGIASRSELARIPLSGDADEAASVAEP
jgi:DNA-binding CsgD family transcriptional regulator